jgi:ech hydrogenase subunit A
VSILTLLILVPLVAGLILFKIQSDRLRGWLVTGAVAFVALWSVNLALQLFDGAVGKFDFGVHWINLAMLAVEMGMGGYLVWVGVRQRHVLVVALAVAQTALMAWFELTQGDQLHVAHNLFVDKFSIIMALINGVVGGVICIYALGYMKEFHEVHHPEVKDRRPLFFGLLFIFLGAMFGLVFANNLLWFFFFWEITTLCSFLLIGYKQNEESKRNALRALSMNLMGGLALAAGIVLFHTRTGSIELTMVFQRTPEVVLVPVALMGFAGLTKSAQLPFSRWLLGAMVAPTPVSALLHSSTMVKAGLYLILRLAPVLYGTIPGTVLALVGATTFLVMSFTALCTSDAKKVLAYSTVANLGLVVLCGGIGTYEAVWAGILMIVFHAVAKCLLFLCVGVVEHKLHSRDIEKMGGLILSLPRISVFLQVGIAGMFLAPFGMLLSKWAVLKAVVDSYPLLTAFVCFGSAPTLFFWVKWLGKLIEVTGPVANVEKNIGLGEWVALYALTGLTGLTCLFFPLISSHLVEPYVMEVYWRAAAMDHGNFVIMTIMLCMVGLFPLSFINYNRKVHVMNAYLGGANSENSGTHFTDARGAARPMTLRNYYFQDLLNEDKIFQGGVFAGLSLLVFLVGFVLL